MQATLLGFGLALIAAIVAAFAAPLFVDWNAWRPHFEARASALAGTRVTIAGKIDATLLPTPAFVLRDVSLGDPDKGTGVRANEIRGALSLGALLTGTFEADEFVISRPAVRLAIAEDGTLLLPDGVSASNADALSVGAFVVEAGSLIVEDRRTQTLVIADDFSARGELLSRVGPFKIESGFRLDGRRWTMRASASRFGADDSGRVRLALDRPADNLSFEAEGALALAKAAPRFDGKIQLSRRGGALPWRVASDAAANTTEVSLSSLEVTLREGEQALSLSGNARFAPRTGGNLDVMLSSKRLDLDGGDTQAAARGVAQTLPLFSELWTLASGLPFAGRMSFSADGVVAGGQLSRDVRAAIRLRRGSVAFEQLEARLPGRGTLNLTGTTSNDVFKGSVGLDSDEPLVLARWLLGAEAAARFGEPDALRVKGDVTYSADRLALDKLEAALGAVKMSGALALQTRGSERPRLEANLKADGIDLEWFVPLMRRTFDGERDFDVQANLSAQAPKIFGTSARAVEVALLATADEITLADLKLDDFEGLTVSARGKLNSFAEPDGRVEFLAEAVRAGGLTILIERVAARDEAFAAALKSVLRMLPLRASGSITADQINRTFDLAATFKTAESSGEISGQLAAKRDDKWPVSTELRISGASFSAKGEIGFAEDGRLLPVLAVEAKAADLRGAFAFVSRAAGAQAVEANAKAKLARDARDFVLDELSFEVAGARGSGRLSIAPLAAQTIGGRIALDRLSVAQLVRLGLGRSDGNNVWPAAPLNSSALSGATGAVEVEIGELSLAGKLAANKVRLAVRVTPAEIAANDLTGEIAGGKFVGTIKFSQANPRTAEVRLKLDAADLSRLTAWQGGSPSMRGRVEGTLAFTATGATPAALTESIAGQGTLMVSNFELDGADPNAPASVVQMAANNAPDEAATARLLSSALARAPLRLAKIEAPILVTNGMFRASNIKAAVGKVDVTGGVALDLPRLLIDTSLTFEAPLELSARPAATLRWQGPLDAPERKIDARALTIALAIRALEHDRKTEAERPRVPPTPPAASLPPTLPDMPSIVVPPVPPPERAPAPKRRPAQTESPPSAAPALPPPLDIRPAPQPRAAPPRAMPPPEFFRN